MQTIDYSKENYITAHPEVRWWEKHLNAKVIKENAHRFTSPVLDLGCNHGACSILLARQNLEVVGVDINPRALEVAKSLVLKEKSLKIDFVEADLRNLPFKSESHGGAIMFDALEHIFPKDIPIVLKEIKRVCKKSSSIVFAVPDEGRYTDPTHVMYFTKEILERTLKQFFEIESIEKDRRHGERRLNAIVRS